jgi:hypothetical protein
MGRLARSEVVKIMNQHALARAEEQRRGLVRPTPTALIDSFTLLDVYTGGVSEEAPRTETLATISAGERIYNTPDGRPGSADRFGKPQRTKPIKLSDGTWAGRIILHDRLGRAPGLARALYASEYGRLTISFPFDDPAQFIKCRFMNYSTSQLLAHGDDTHLMVLRPNGYTRIEAGTPEYRAEVARCKVSVSVYFCLAEWTPNGAEVAFPDGVGAYYRLRFTSRHSLRSILAGLRSIGQFTQGAIAGVPFELMIDFREVAGSDGKKRTVPVWTIATRPPETFKLTSGNFQQVMGHAIGQGKALMLPAPPEPTIDQALEDGPEIDLDDSGVEGVVVTAPTEHDVHLVQCGGRCDSGYWNRMWHAAVKKSRFENDQDRAEFLLQYTSGETDSLSLFLGGATERAAQAAVLAVTEQINLEREERPSTSRPAQPAPVSPSGGARTYQDLFPDDDDEERPAPPASDTVLVTSDQLITLPQFDHEASYSKPQLVDAYRTWVPVLQALDPTYTATWSGNGPERVPFGDLDDAVRDLVTRAMEIHAERLGVSDADEEPS